MAKTKTVIRREWGDREDIADRDSEYISAILFSNSGTISKFNRMGYLSGCGSKRVKMIRTGTCYNHEANSEKPKSFVYEVGDEKFPETWGQGLSMFHNPYARYPVNPQLFPDIAHHILEEGQISSFLEDFHPLASVTQIIVCT